MSKKEVKTNAMRMLDRAKVSYTYEEYECDDFTDGIQTADKLGYDHKLVYKTLVTTGRSGGHYVFMIPVAEELDLKKAAAAAGEKSIEMLKSKELLPLTGYVHGGCSPIGMKKPFPTVIHASAADIPKIIFSAGRIGYQVELTLDDLAKVLRFTLADVIVEAE